MSKHMYSTANLTDKELKEQGNRLFSLRRYEDAMNCYTKAIVSNSLIFINKMPFLYVLYNVIHLCYLFYFPLTWSITQILVLRNLQVFHEVGR